MNNTFSFERFGKVLAIDFKNYFRSYGITLVVLCCIPVALWILSLVVGLEFDSLSRGSNLYFICAIAILLAPTKVYGKANLPREGVAFAMLPASALEKFFSMLLYCAILTPFLCLMGGWVIDSLLTLLPFGGFHESVHLFDVNSVSQPDTFFSSFRLWYSVVLGMVFWSAIFMLGNMIFKKRKVGKTLACYLGIGFITVIFSIIILKNNIGDVFENITDAKLISVFNFGLLVSTALLLVAFYFVYRKIKNQNY